MTQRDIKKIDKTILDNFYKLVHTQENVRITAASSSFKILSTMKKNQSQSDKFNENLNYSVERLVTGLASSRALARKGYGTLLLELLKTFQISTERLFTIAQQKFGQISRETQRDELLAYFLLISIVLESGNYERGKNRQYLEKIYKFLMQLLSIKSYLEYSVCNLLVNHYELFYPYMMAGIDPQMFGSDSKASANDLLIMVLCNKKEPLRALLALDSSSLMNLCHALLDEKFQKRPLHPIFSEVSQFIITNYPAQFEKFYNDVLQPTFFKANHNELATMGLEFTANLIESIDSPEAIEILLNKHLIRLLIVSLRGKSSLHAQSKKFFASLENHFKKLQSEVIEMIDEETLPIAKKRRTNKEKETNIDQSIILKQKTILYSITSSPGSIAFDEDSLSTSVSSLLQHCNAQVLREYLQTRLLSLFHRKADKNESKQLEVACAKQVAFIVRRPQMIKDQDTLAKAAKFLLFNSLFRVKELDVKNMDPSFWSSDKLSAPTRNASEISIQSFKDAFHSTLDHIVSTCDAQQRSDQLEQLVDFSEKLFNSNSVEYLGNKTLNDSGDLEELWSFYKECLHQHMKIVKKNKDKKQLYPITLLHLFYGLQIVEHQLDCRMQLEELAESSTNALKDSRTIKDSSIDCEMELEEPEDSEEPDDAKDGSFTVKESEISWADVLTDQILAILSATECSAWIRKLCERVFGLLIPFITAKSIELLCNAVKIEVDNEEDDEEEDGEDNESDDEENVDEPPKVIDKKLENGESKMQIDDKSAETSEDEEYLDDDRMIEMDAKLAEMFKIKKSILNKSNLFKLRVVDLIEKFISYKKKKDKKTINYLLKTLHPLIANEKPPLNTRVQKIMNNVKGKKSYPKFFPTVQVKVPPV